MRTILTLALCFAAVPAFADVIGQQQKQGQIQGQLQGQLQGQFQKGNTQDVNFQSEARGRETSGVPSFGLSTHGCISMNSVSGGGMGMVSVGGAWSTANEDCQKMKAAEMFMKMFQDTKTAQALMSDLSFVKELRGEQKALLMEYEQAKVTQEKLEGVPPVYQSALKTEDWNPER